MYGLCLFTECVYAPLFKRLFGDCVYAPLYKRLYTAISTFIYCCLNVCHGAYTGLQSIRCLQLIPPRTFFTLQVKGFTQSYFPLKVMTFCYDSKLLKLSMLLYKDESNKRIRNKFSIVFENAGNYSKNRDGNNS